MRLATKITLAIGAALFASAPSLAARHHASVGLHHPVKRSSILVAQEYAELQHSCSWVGPGGRAVYVCKTVSAAPVINAPPHKPVCGWVGPAAPPRSIYTCQ